MLDGAAAPVSVHSFTMRHAPITTVALLALAACATSLATGSVGRGVYTSSEKESADAAVEFGVMPLFGSDMVLQASSGPYGGALTLSTLLTTSCYVLAVIVS